jgi:UDP-glucose 4-epimerase
MRILVTGGAGFIGSNVVDGYLRCGHQVAIVDNLTTGFRHNVAAGAVFHQVDIRDGKAIQAIFDAFKPDVVNHHAAQMDVRRSTIEPVYDAECNILGSLNLILAAARSGVKRFVYASTGGAVYGSVPRSDLPVDEDHTIDPISQYGVSKHTVEHYLFVYHALSRLSFVVLRYPNVFGPRQTPHGEAGVVAIFAGRLMSSQPCTIFGNGGKTRDYVFVDDIVAANILATDSDFVGVLNLGSGIGTSDLEVFDAVSSAVGGEGRPVFAPGRPGEVEHIALAAGRAKATLNWEPKIGFREGVKRTVHHLRESSRL